MALFMQAFLIFANIMVPILINTEIFLILFQIFFFITLHAGKIAKKLVPPIFKWDDLILESKSFDLKIKFVW